MANSETCPRCGERDGATSRLTRLESRLAGVPVAAAPQPRRSRAISHGVCAGDDFTDDEIEFMKALDQFKREHRRPFPTCSDVLAVVKSLGYRK